MTCCISSELNIIGFLEMSKVECPATLSRHLVLPQRASDESPESIDASSKTPSFCVLLHGALKVNFSVYNIHIFKRTFFFPENLK